MKVWDLFIRSSHWIIVLMVTFAWLSARYGDVELKWHSWNGYALFVLILSKVIWGFVGSTTARFSHFIKSPKIILQYLRSLFLGYSKETIGHNPAGGVMVLILYLLLIVQGLTGLFSTDDVFFEGPFAYYISESFVKSATALHHYFFNTLIILIIVHIIAVIYHQLVKKEKLLQAMILGTKPTLTRKEKDETALVFKPFFLALFITGFVAFAFWLTLNIYG